MLPFGFNIQGRGSLTPAFSKIWWRGTGAHFYRNMWHHPSRREGGEAVSAEAKNYRRSWVVRNSQGSWKSSSWLWPGQPQEHHVPESIANTSWTLSGRCWHHCPGLQLSRSAFSAVAQCAAAVWHLGLEVWARGHELLTLCMTKATGGCGTDPQRHSRSWLPKFFTWLYFKSIKTLIFLGPSLEAPNLNYFLIALWLNCCKDQDI